MKRGEKMTKEECVKLKNSFKLVSHNGFKAYVNPLGEVYVWNGKEYVKRQWRINADGYVVVTLQSRHGGKNGRAKSCQLFYEREKLIGTFDCQRDAVNYLINLGLVKKENNKETIIHYLKQDNGYKNYYLKII